MKLLLSDSILFLREDSGVGAVWGGCSSAHWVHSCAPMWSIAEF